MAMLVACLPLLMALFLGHPSTVTAQTLDISGPFGRNPELSRVIGDKHLLELLTHSVEHPHILDEYRSSNLLNPTQISKNSVSNIKNHEFETLLSQMPGRISRTSYIPNGSEYETNLNVSCPEPDAIAPCSCFIAGSNGSVADQLQLDCSYIQSIEQLAEVFRQDFPFKEFYEFRIIFNNNIKYLTDIFNGVSFRNIYLYYDLNLIEISDHAFFDSVNYLENIDIYGSGLDENNFPFSTLDEFPKLKWLTIAGSDLNSWPAFVSSSITSINFHTGHVSSLPADTFAGLPLINSWYGNFNAITVLEAGTFRLKTGSNYIGMYGNNLTTVQPGTFVLPATVNDTSDMNLEVEFGYNSLTTLEEAVYGDIFPFVTTFFIDANPLACGCDLAWLVTNPDYMDKIISYATCDNGTYLSELDPQLYIDMCFQ